MYKEETYNSRPVKIIGLSILFFFIFSFLPDGLQIGPFQLKPVDILIDVKPDSLLTQNNQPGSEDPFTSNNSYPED